MVRRLMISFKELGARCAAKDTFSGEISSGLLHSSWICWFEATELHSIAGRRQLERFDLDETLKRYRDEKLPRRKQSSSWAWATAAFGTAKRFGLGLGLGLGLVSDFISCLLIRIALQEQSLLVSQPLLEDILQGASGVEDLAS